MEIQRIHIIGIILGIVVIASALLVYSTNWFPFLVGIGIIIIVFPFVFSIIRDVNLAAEKEEMFLEFARNLVESVKTGNSINNSIIHLSKRNYGSLTKNIQKLANQITLGIPLNQALRIFSEDVNNPVISRAINLIGNAERAGGDIGEILESVASAVSTTNKLKKERKAAISALVAQNYIIFFVFIIIILIVQFKIIPMLGSIENISNTPQTSEVFKITQKSMQNTFLTLLIVQGFFSGLIIGKLAEGKIKAGIKHSFILIILSFLIFSGANILFM